jgi:diguanylate cyclase (GGDEF)-like protein
MKTASTQEIIRNALQRRPPRPVSYAGGVLGLCAAGQLGLQLLLQPSAAAQLYLLAFAATTLVPLAYFAGRMVDHLQELALHDGPTGLWNRRYLGTRLADEVCRARREHIPLSLLFLDVDDLKAINDAGGHKAGDRALRSVADALRRSCRCTDVVARFGGDEFVVIAPSTTAREALEIAGRIRTALHKLGPPALTLPLVTVSAGLAEVERAGSDPDSLLRAADAAMYAAKSLGGDRCMLTPAAPVPPRTPLPRPRARGDAASHLPRFVRAPVAGSRIP